MIIFDNVSKSYGSLKALDHFNLEIHPGEILGLLGPNGAGKSTSIHLAMGLIQADAGQVLLHGRSPREPDVRRRIGIAPQTLSLYEEMTGRENVTFFAQLYGYSGARLAARVEAALEFVKLTERQHDIVSTYSGGMQRRLNIATAIVHEPDLILLDEPTVGVDPQSRNAIFDNVLALRNQGKTVIYTTHYMEEAQRLCDRIAIVDHGKLLALDSPNALLERHGGPAALVVQQNGDVRRYQTQCPLDTLNALAQSGPLDSFNLEQPTLEQVFLTLTGRSLRE